MNSTDVLVVGGGPAGLATAIAARQRGLDVVVVDGWQPPVDKPCGEGLMPDACAALATFGVTLLPEESHPFHGIEFISGPRRVNALFPDGAGIGVRRTVLHRAMIARAEALAVSLRWRSPVTGLHPEGARIGKQVIRSRWVVGADGGDSRVRRWAGLDRITRQRRFAFRRHYGISPWTDYMELHWGRNAQIYVTPVACDEVCVAVVSHDPHLRLDQALQEFPEIASRLQGAASSSTERGAVSSSRKLRKVFRDRVVLVGDASGTVDCITGEGLGLAFRQASLLADCLAQNDLRPYQRQHAKLARRPALMSRLLLALDSQSSLRERAMGIFSREPQLFGRMVAMHVGALSSVDCAATGLALGWRLLTC